MSALRDAPSDAAFSVTSPAQSPRIFPRSRASIAIGVLASALLLAACGAKNDAPAAGGGAPPPPEVGVVTVSLGNVGLVNELPGRLEASRIAEIRARAAGILQKRLFTEGSDVKAGQPLFTIDAAPYAAAYESAQASLGRAEANLANAAAIADRYRPLVEANAISRQDYIAATTAQKQAQADVAIAKAAVQTAKINLDHSRVTAPISGRIGRALVTEGALVGQGEATQLAVVQQIDPMYVNFTQSASDAMRLRQAMDNGLFKRAPGSEAASVAIVMEDGTPYASKGRLLFTDLTVDPTSGQVTLRAEVPNPEKRLLPGLFVRVRIEQAQAGGAMLLPQQAVTRSSQGDTVMVVGPDGHVTPRTVKLGPSQGNQWVVLDGLKADEKVMVDGFQKLPRGKPGDPIVVKPVQWQAPGAAAKAPAAPASATPAASAASAAPAAKQ